MRKLLIPPLLCLFTLGACQKEDAKNPIYIDESALPIIFSETAGYKQIRLTSSAPWEATLVGTEDDWCRLSPVKGEAGSVLLSIQAQLNSRRNDRSVTIILRSGNATRKIEVVQVSKEHLQIESTVGLISPLEQNLNISITSNVVVNSAIEVPARGWLRNIGQTRTTIDGGLTRYTFHYRIEKNLNTEDRTTALTFSGNLQTNRLTISQAGIANDIFYESTDYSADRRVTKLQQATEGKGINIVLMGDAFSDKLHADGTYHKYMCELSEILFSCEPFRTFRHLFNVYTVAVVSKNQAYNGAQQTALSTTFTSETGVTGNHDQCQHYAMQVPGITPELLKNTLIVVLMNSLRHAGTTYWWLPNDHTDYGCGNAIAYFTMDRRPAERATLAIHEALGHGFAKLADEYTRVGNEVIPSEVIASARLCEPFGWFKNIDFTNNHNHIKWHRMLTDDRYIGTGLYIFEGGYTYRKGVFRPTSESIMNNSGTFNAPSREAIYYRIHKLAYGPTWTYDYETFVEYDAMNRNTESASVPTTEQTNIEPTPAPRFVDTTF